MGQMDACTYIQITPVFYRISSPFGAEAQKGLMTCFESSSVEEVDILPKSHPSKVFSNIEIHSSMSLDALEEKLSLSLNALVTKASQFCTNSSF